VKPTLAPDARPAAKLSFAVARAVARASRLWGQRGLGTLYQTLERLPLLGRSRGTVEFLPGARFETGLFEPYWAPTIVWGRAYEPELLALMKRFAPLEPTFVDGGANFGFWSIVATSPEVAFPRAVAIEANQSTYEHLRLNCDLNGGRFECTHRALSDQPGVEVALGQTDSHAIAHVVQNGSGPRVMTTSIDALVDELDWRRFDRFVLKIDVEGHEIAAIRGAARLTRERDHVWVLEDFVNSGLTTLAYVIEQGYRAYYVDARDRCYEVRTIEDAASRERQDRRAGRARNFFAAREGSAFQRVLDRW
jgi:FkbM family methyltransferase